MRNAGASQWEERLVLFDALDGVPDDAGRSLRTVDGHQRFEHGDLRPGMAKPSPPAIQLRA
jgi:hypothetical protein